MIHNFRSIALSYKTAPLSVREILALTEEQCKALLSTVRDVFDVTDLLIISTCNRTELYYSASEDLSIELIKLLCVHKGISNSENYIPYFTPINNQNEAIEHLFRVAIGLESQVVGDLQITNQVKQAYQWSADANLAGPFLHRLLHTIFFTNKRVVQETSFRDGAASVSYATVELVELLVADKSEAKVLVIGLGEIGADVCRNLSASKLENITLCNRTLDKALALAEECQVRVLTYENLWEQIVNYDVIICSVVMPEPLITKQRLATLDILSHKYLVDLSVPRSIDSAVEQIPGVLLYNIDQIRNTANEALQMRVEAVPEVERLIEESIHEFSQWNQEMVVSPTIQKLKSALEQIRTEELSRFAKQLNGLEAKMVDQITRNIMQKIIKLPVLQLKAACKRGEADSLIDVLNELFNLENQVLK
jgi:glutamyl-tRNA reductase